MCVQTKKYEFESQISIKLEPLRKEVSSAHQKIANKEAKLIALLQNSTETISENELLKKKLTDLEAGITRKVSKIESLEIKVIKKEM